VAAPNAGDSTTASIGFLQQQQQQHQHLTAQQLELQLRQLHQLPSQPQVAWQHQHQQLQQHQHRSQQLQRHTQSDDGFRNAAADSAFTSRLKQCTCWQQLLHLVVDHNDQLGLSSDESSGMFMQMGKGRQQQQERKQQQQQQHHHHQQQQMVSVPLQDISRRLAQLNPRHLSCLLCMLVKFQPATASTTVGSEQSKVFNQFAKLVFTEAVQQLSYMAPRELSNILWTAAKVQQPPAAQQVKQMFKQIASNSMLATANPQDLSMALYAVAALGVQVPELQLEAVLQAAVRQLHAAAPQAVANTIWAVAVLQYRPNEQWLQAFEQRCCNLLRQQLPQLHEQEQDIRLGEADQLPAEQYTLVQKRAQDWGISSKGLHQLLWSFAKLQWLPTNEFQQLFWAVSSGQLSSMSPHGTAGLLWAAATLQMQPSALWMQTWYSATSRQLNARLFGDQDAANALWALVRLRQKPDSSWLSVAMAGSWAVLADAGAQELSNLLWGWAKLGVRPDPAWMSDWLRAMSKVMSRYGCACRTSAEAWHKDCVLCVARHFRVKTGIFLQRCTHCIQFAFVCLLSASKFAVQWTAPSVSTWKAKEGSIAVPAVQ
jgi:hypothetical protein